VWWETVWERVRREDYTRISGLGIFVGTQILALVTGAPMHFSGSKPNWIMSAVTLTLCVVDLIAVVLTVRFLLGERVQDTEELKPSQVAGE
jgi:protein-S-isoprenylcysteine O-methyltransferase Ste14